MTTSLDLPESQGIFATFAFAQLCAEDNLHLSLDVHQGQIKPLNLKLPIGAVEEMTISLINGLIAERKQLRMRIVAICDELHAQHRLEGTPLVAGHSRITVSRPRGPEEACWAAIPESLSGNDLQVRIHRTVHAVPVFIDVHHETWNLVHTLQGIKSRFYHHVISDWRISDTPEVPLTPLPGSALPR